MIMTNFNKAGGGREEWENLILHFFPVSVWPGRAGEVSFVGVARGPFYPCTAHISLPRSPMRGAGIKGINFSRFDAHDSVFLFIPSFIYTLCIPVRVSYWEKELRWRGRGKMNNLTLRCWRSRGEKRRLWQRLMTDWRKKNLHAVFSVRCIGDAAARPPFEMDVRFLHDFCVKKWPCVSILTKGEEIYA